MDDEEARLVEDDAHALDKPRCSAPDLAPDDLVAGPPSFSSRGAQDGQPITSPGVSATIIDGKALAEKVRGEVAAEVAELGHVGLTTVLVGDDPASHVYINLKQKHAQGIGIQANDIRLPGDTTQDEVLALLAELNADDAVDGILVQLPLPGHLDENTVIEAISPAKDVDGIHPFNAGRLYLGRPVLVPGTPLGIMRMLEEYEIETKGARAVVIGRSNIVGKPMAHLLLQAHATVTICHSRTEDLQRHTLDADILVAAVGQLHIVGADMVKAGAAVIDVGMNRTDEGLFGDVDPDAADRAAYLTPVPGGVGPMTIAMVLKNTVTAARRRRRFAETGRGRDSGS
jgi:methylenetetrahydrofolate dehydrogenase (NADP+) / methenyltetrahydrofolate cyclohydrolase